MSEATQKLSLISVPMILLGCRHNTIKEDVLRSIPGGGPVLSQTMRAQVPELGTLSHK